MHRQSGSPPAQHPEYGRLIRKVECWGCGYTNLNWMQASPCRTANLPQIRLEPIMKARAEELNPGSIRFHHELILACRLLPDSKLRINDIGQPRRGPGGVIAAGRREGLVIAESQKGYRVAPLSVEDLRDLTEARVADRPFSVDRPGRP